MDALLRPATAALLVLFSAPLGAAAQDVPLDSLLRRHSYVLEVRGGRLLGEGADLLTAAAEDAQFVGIMEEHNVAEIADFSAALFRELHDTDGFRYLAVEQGGIITRWLNAGERRGDLAAMAELVGRFPHAPTFATDQEIAMMAAVADRSSAAHTPVWGVDQELGAWHLLQRLEELAPTNEARRVVRSLASVAARFESSREGDTLYLSQVARPADFADLPRLFEGAGPEAEELVESLRRTNRIYHNWYRAAVLGEATGYENGREREASMKQRFMEEYRRALAVDDALPRVVAKLGHWHLLRGIYRANVPTFGNFLSELAVSNGMEAFLVSTYVVESPEAWRNATGPIAEAAGEGTYTLIDFRPLRPLAHAGRIGGLPDGVRSLLFRADAALVVRGGRSGDFTMARDEWSPGG